MSEPLEELYFTWLYSRVASPRLRSPVRTYWKLLQQLHHKEFIWLVPNDDNRVEDGRALRYEFLNEQQIVGVDIHWMELGCSMLEMLVALSDRLAFEAEGEPGDWFFHLLRNLELDGCNDRDILPEKEIDEILDRVIWRNFRPDGSGGLFPLRRAAQDQRRVEIWYQMSAYILEHD